MEHQEVVNLDSQNSETVVDPILNDTIKVNTSKKALASEEPSMYYISNASTVLNPNYTSLPKPHIRTNYVRSNLTPYANNSLHQYRYIYGRETEMSNLKKSLKKEGIKNVILDAGQVNLSFSEKKKGSSVSIKSLLDLLITDNHPYYTIYTESFLNFLKDTQLEQLLNVNSFSEKVLLVSTYFYSEIARTLKNENSTFTITEEIRYSDQVSYCLSGDTFLSKITSNNSRDHAKEVLKNIGLISYILNQSPNSSQEEKFDLIFSNLKPISDKLECYEEFLTLYSTTNYISVYTGYGNTYTEFIGIKTEVAKGVNYEKRVMSGHFAKYMNTDSIYENLDNMIALVNKDLEFLNMEVLSMKKRWIIYLGDGIVQTPDYVLVKDNPTQLYYSNFEGTNYGSKELDTHLRSGISPYVCQGENNNYFYKSCLYLGEGYTFLLKHKDTGINETLVNNGLMPRINFVEKNQWEAYVKSFSNKEDYPEIISTLEPWADRMFICSDWCERNNAALYSSGIIDLQTPRYKRYSIVDWMTSSWVDRVTKYAPSLLNMEGFLESVKVSAPKSALYYKKQKQTKEREKGTNYEKLLESFGKQNLVEVE